jgi:hypothetical protein
MLFSRTPHGARSGIIFDRRTTEVGATIPRLDNISLMPDKEGHWSSAAQSNNVVPRKC